ncbi:MAG: hypothetical protein DDT32_01545 [Syntrophomonadaceae bacterium]|nr:hypothetical protein [Bacillota bacterium]
MATYQINIPGTLPGLNEYIRAERANRYLAAKIKRQSEEVIGLILKSQLRGVRIIGPVSIHYTWIEPNTRRDKDNIAFAKKFIQDSLVQIGALQGDGWAHISGFSDTFGIDKLNPRISIFIKEEEV